MQKLIIDNRFYNVATKYFKGRFHVIPSPVIKGLPPEVASHTDMGLVRIGDVFVAEPTVYDYYKKVLFDKTILCGKTEISAHYPQDIAYNVLISETVAFGNEAYVDPCVKEVLKSQGIALKNVKQGYSKCACVYAFGCVITADKGMYESAKKENLPALLISPGDVRLSGFDYGFLGGATGELDEKLFFFGDVTKHRDYEKIKAFLNENKIEFEFFKDVPLTDVGTILCV